MNKDGSTVLQQRWRNDRLRKMTRLGLTIILLSNKLSRFNHLGVNSEYIIGMV